MTKLKISNNKENVLNEIGDGKFKLDFDGFILHLKSFIDKNKCNQIVSSLKEVEKDKVMIYKIVMNLKMTIFIFLNLVNVYIILYAIILM